MVLDEEGLLCDEVLYKGFYDGGEGAHILLLRLALGEEKAKGWCPAPRL